MESVNAGLSCQDDVHWVSVTVNDPGQGLIVVSLPSRRLGRLFEYNPSLISAR